MEVGEIELTLLKNVLRMEKVQKRGKRLKMTLLLVLASTFGFDYAFLTFRFFSFEIVSL